MDIAVIDRSTPVNLGVNMHLQPPRELVDMRYTSVMCLECYKTTINHGVEVGVCRWRKHE